MAKPRCRKKRKMCKTRCRSKKGRFKRCRPCDRRYYVRQKCCKPSRGTCRRRRRRCRSRSASVAAARSRSASVCSCCHSSCSN